MSKEELIKLMLNFREAFNNKELEKLLSYLAEDADWIHPFGEFRGKEAIRKFLKWGFKMSPDQKIVPSGADIMAEEDKAIAEHLLEGSHEGMKYQVLGYCTYEAKRDKIQHLRTAYDRLSQAKQLAKGKIAQTAVNSVIKQMGKDLAV